jgi:Serine/threonine protein kinase
MDIDGHLHLADFGLCKIVEDKNQLNYTFCGSPEYLAPEVIEKTGYNFTVDFYCLGILIYEMVVGHPPFLENTRSELYNSILKHDIYYPSHLSPKLKSFLSEILHKDPKKRLGAANGLSDIVNHPWCRNIDFVKIITKKFKGPIIPELYKSNFAQEFMDARLSIEEESMPTMITTQGSFTRMPFTMTESIMNNKYRRFAAYSFYCNLDDPEDKYIDSLFATGKNSPREDSPEPVPRKLTADALYSKVVFFM